MLFWHVVRTLQVLVVLIMLLFYLYSRARSGDVQQHRTVMQNTLPDRNGVTPLTAIANNSRFSDVLDVDSRPAMVFIADAVRSSGAQLGDAARGRENGAARNIASNVSQYITNRYPIFIDSKNASVVSSPVYRKSSFNSQTSKYKLFNSTMVSDDYRNHIFFNNYSNSIENSEPLNRGKIKRIPLVQKEVMVFVNQRRDIPGSLFSALKEGQAGAAGVAALKEGQAGAAGVAALKEGQAGATGAAGVAGVAGVAALKEGQAGAAEAAGAAGVAGVAGVATLKERQQGRPGVAGVAALKEGQAGAAGAAGVAGVAGVATLKERQQGRPGVAGVAAPADSGDGGGAGTPFWSLFSTKPTQTRVNLTTPTAPIGRSSYRELCLLHRPALHHLTVLQLLLTPPTGSSGQESLLRRLLCLGSVGYGAAANRVHGRNQHPEKLHSEKTKDVEEAAAGTVTVETGYGRLFPNKE